MGYLRRAYHEESFLRIEPKEEERSSLKVVYKRDFKAEKRCAGFERYGYQGKESLDEEGLDTYDFHARYYDPALGRFTSVDPQHQFMSGYVGMGNNPVMMVDPTGEVAFLAVAAVIAKAAAIGAGVSAVTYTAAVGFSDGGFQNWDWGQFGTSVGTGALSGALTAGIATGVSAGAFALGASTSTANFIGGFVGSFSSGSIMNGGIPTDPAQLALLTGTSALQGATYSNPFTAPADVATEVADDIPNFGDDYIMLPEVEIEALRSGNYPFWWGNTELVRRMAWDGSLYREHNFVRGVENFFSDNQTELRWMQLGDQYYLYEHTNYVGGTAPAIGPGGASNVRKGYQLTRNIGNKYQQYTKVVKAGKLPGQARAEYVKILNKQGQTVKMFKDSYRIDGRFFHRRLMKPTFKGQPRYLK